MSELGPRLDAAFDALRTESAAPPDGAAMGRARLAMHRARTAQPERRRGPAAWVGGALRRRVLLPAGAGTVAAVAVVAALGWNAPAGSPLHGVRVAHESIALALPGSDRVGLDLDYAESRMRETQQQSGSWAPDLDEAGRLLDDARRHLRPGAALWSRWQGDEKLLGELRQEDRAGHDDGGAPGSPEPPGDDGGGGSGDGDSGGGGSRSSSSTSSTSRESSQSTTATSTSGDGDHGGSSSTSSSTSSQTATSDGGDGGSSSTSSSGGDGGGSGGDGD